MSPIDPVSPIPLEQDSVAPEAPLTEREGVLLRRAQSGEDDAFCALVEPAELRLYHQAIRLCGNEDTAKDLAQETLLAAWKSIGRYHGKCRLSTWLYAILLRIHWKRLRYLNRRPLDFFGLGSKAMEGSTQRDPGSIWSEKESASAMRRLVDTLPVKYREVVCLRFFEEASLEEIGQALGIKTGTVKSRLFYALERLRKMNLKEWR